MNPGTPGTRVYVRPLGRSVTVTLIGGVPLVSRTQSSTLSPIWRIRQGGAVILGGTPGTSRVIGAMVAGASPRLTASSRTGLPASAALASPEISAEVHRVPIAFTWVTLKPGGARRICIAGTGYPQALTLN
jgi:hypothetical protein